MLSTFAPPPCPFGPQYSVQYSMQLQGMKLVKCVEIPTMWKYRKKQKKKVKALRELDAAASVEMHG